MRSNQIMLLAGVALVAFVVLLSVYDADRAGSTKSPSDPQRATPSKENVSKNVKEKIDHLRRVVEKNPSDSQTIFQLAQLLQDAHNVQEAAKYYTRGLTIDGRNDLARVDYSLCLFEMGKSKEALEQNMIMLRRDPRNVRASYNAGAIYANIGEIDSARVYWTQVVSFHPDDELAEKARENLKKLSGISFSS